jgi:hypothetical protein
VCQGKRGSFRPDVPASRPELLPWPTQQGLHLGLGYTAMCLHVNACIHGMCMSLVHVHMWICVCIHLCAYVRMCEHGHTCEWMHVDVCTCVPACMCVCVYTMDFVTAHGKWKILTNCTCHQLFKPSPHHRRATGSCSAETSVLSSGQDAWEEMDWRLGGQAEAATVGGLGQNIIHFAVIIASCP